MGDAGVARPLGTRNIEVARDFVRKLGIRVVLEDVGGASGRKLIYQTHEGLAIVNRIH